MLTVTVVAHTATAASFWVGRFMGFRAWRSIDYLTFVLFVSAAVHGILAGIDMTEPWARAIYLSSAGIVFSLIAYRVQYRCRRRAPALSSSWRLPGR